MAHNGYLGGVTAAQYFHETDLHGALPHFSPAQIATAPPNLRQAADTVLATAYGMVPMLPNKANRAIAREGCQRLAPGSRTRDEVQIPPGGALLADLGTRAIAVFVRRFAPLNLPVPIGFLTPKSISRIPIPRDSVARSWRLTALGQSPLVICPLAGRAP